MPIKPSHLGRQYNSHGSRLTVGFARIDDPGVVCGCIPVLLRHQVWAGLNRTLQERFEISSGGMFVLGRHDTHSSSFWCSCLGKPTVAS